MLEMIVNCTEMYTRVVTLVFGKFSFSSYDLRMQKFCSRLFLARWKYSTILNLKKCVLQQKNCKQMWEIFSRNDGHVVQVPFYYLDRKMNRISYHISRTLRHVRPDLEVIRFNCSELLSKRNNFLMTEKKWIWCWMNHWRAKTEQR